MKRPYYVPHDAMLHQLRRKQVEFRSPWPMRFVWLFAALFWAVMVWMVAMMRP